MPAEFTNNADQVGMIPRSQTGGHFFGRKPITGDSPLKQFQRHGIAGHGMAGLLGRRLPVRFVDDSRGAFA